MMMLSFRKTPWRLLSFMAVIVAILPNNAFIRSRVFFCEAFNSSKPIPITILSGFLGTGKTTLLQNMLQNKEGMKIAVVVNDVASVNIDSKLVARGEPDGGGVSDGMVELQNGCACCSLSDELLTSVSQLVTMSDLRAEDDQFDHIVVELSGVADPKSVRAKFQEAAMEQMPLMERVQLDTMVTLIDASTFTDRFKSTKTASRKEMPELFYREGESEEDDDAPLDDWMKDLPPKLLDAVMAEINGSRGEDESNGVADLLVSQTETADLVVLNKEDLTSTAEMDQLKDIVGALNPRAKIVTTSYGKLSIGSVLAIAGGKGVAQAGAVDDHRDYVGAAANAIEIFDDVESHSHDHDHDLEEEEEDEDIVDASHSHDHDHDCVEPDCTDASHSHSHDHDCADADCTDSSHSHSHDHDACTDPDCTDTSHSHSHSHASDSAHAGIGTFVFKARRPFHPGRLVTFLRYLPVVRGIPETQGDDDDETTKLDIADEAKEALLATLRSKGFVWCANSHADAMYWSHAGSSFDLSCLGSWWATLPRDQWPPGVDAYVLEDFDDPEHDDATNPVGVGDRRQEVVFIGSGFDDAICQADIGDALCQCLLDDEEYEEYKAMQSDEEKLRARFANAIDSKVMSY